MIIKCFSTAAGKTTASGTTATTSTKTSTTTSSTNINININITTDFPKSNGILDLIPPSDDEPSTPEKSEENKFYSDPSDTSDVKQEKDNSGSESSAAVVPSLKLEMGDPIKPETEDYSKPITPVPAPASEIYEKIEVVSRPIDGNVKSALVLIRPADRKKKSVR